jgi:hypothetical protein
MSYVSTKCKLIGDVPTEIKGKNGVVINIGDIISCTSSVPGQGITDKTVESIDYATGKVKVKGATSLYDATKVCTSKGAVPTEIKDKNGVVINIGDIISCTSSVYGQGITDKIVESIDYATGKVKVKGAINRYDATKVCTSKGAAPTSIKNTDGDDIRVGQMVSCEGSSRLTSKDGVVKSIVGTKVFIGSTSYEATKCKLIGDVPNEVKDKDGKVLKVGELVTCKSTTGSTSSMAGGVTNEPIKSIDYAAGKVKAGSMGYSYVAATKCTSAGDAPTEVKDMNGVVIHVNDLVTCKSTTGSTSSYAGGVTNAPVKSIDYAAGKVKAGSAGFSYVAATKCTLTSPSTSTSTSSEPGQAQAPGPGPGENQGEAPGPGPGENQGQGQGNTSISSEPGQNQGQGQGQGSTSSGKQGSTSSGKQGSTSRGTQGQGQGSTRNGRQGNNGPNGKSSSQVPVPVNAIGFEYTSGLKNDTKKIIKRLEEDTHHEVLIARDGKGKVIYKDGALEGGGNEKVTVSFDGDIDEKNINAIKTDKQLDKIKNSTLKEVGVPTGNIKVVNEVKAAQTPRFSTENNLPNGAVEMPSTPGDPMPITIESYKGPLMIGAHQSIITTSDGITFADVAIKETAEGHVGFYRISGTQDQIEAGIRALTGKPIQSDDINKVSNMLGRQIANLQGDIGTLGQDLAQQLSDNDIRLLPQAQQNVAMQTKAALQDQDAYLRGQLTKMQRLQNQVAVAAIPAAGGARRTLSKRRVSRRRVSKRTVSRRRVSRRRVSKRTVSRRR